VRHSAARGRSPGLGDRDHGEVRCVTRVLLLAAVLLVAGCSLFRDSDVRVARITAISAPDTVTAYTRFDVTFTAMLGTEGGYMLDHFEATYTDDQIALRVWSRDTSTLDVRPQVIVFRDLTLDAGPMGPGQFRIIGHQPDGRDTVKTITVLP
jgi:hypothetical protein